MFFMVLDLRLMRLGLGGAPFFLSFCEENMHGLTNYSYFCHRSVKT